MATCRDLQKDLDLTDKVYPLKQNNKWNQKKNLSAHSLARDSTA